MTIRETCKNRPRTSETKFAVKACLLVASLFFALNSCSAESTKLSPLRRIDRSSLDKVVSTAAKAMKIPGAVVLLQTPQGTFKINYGSTQIGMGTAPSDSTHFRIASNTKTMTAALILLLAQENKLKLEDPISKYVSGVPNGDKITIANLLEMRSGLYNYTSAPEVAESIDRHPTKVWTEKELLAIICKHPTTAPDKLFHWKYDYNNSNYFLLGLVVEKVGGMPLRQAMQKRLFDPLHMSNTQLPEVSSNAIPKVYSHGYLYGSSSVALAGIPPYSAKFKADAKAGKILPKDYTDVNHSFAAAAGGVTSTAADCATWISALATGTILNPQYQKIWRESLRLEDPSNTAGMEYGYGISRLHWGPNAFLFHGGETVGYNSFIGFDPVNKVTLVVWTNLTVSLDELPTANSLMLRVLDHIYVESPIPPAKH